MVQYHRKSLELHWDVLEPLAVQESILVVHHTQQLEYFNTDDYWQRIGYDRVNGNGSKEMGRIGLLCHGSNLHRFGIGSNGLGSTLKNAKFKGDNILISTQVHSTQFDLSQFDLSYSTKRVDLTLFDLFHSTHFMQSGTIIEIQPEPF